MIVFIDPIKFYLFMVNRIEVKCPVQNTKLAEAFIKEAYFGRKRFSEIII